MSTAESTPEPGNWVTLKHPVTKDDDGTAKAFCSFIEKFLWREHNGQPELLVVINNSNGPRNRYKYKGVPRAKFESAWERAYNPSKYDNNFGSWFTNNVKNTHEYERFE